MEAEDGNQALKILENQTVDLVVTDIQMPGMDGFELARRIRAEKSLQHLPIIAVTSLANEEDRRAGSKAGIDVYLIKLKREQLLKEITRLLASASTEAQKLAS